MSEPSREHLFRKIADWSSEASQRDRGILAPELVHKSRPENVAVARIDRFDPDRPDHCLAEIFVDSTHPYFFEHEIDHVPALLLIEAVRQAGVAAAHQFLGVPLDAAMIVDELKVGFQHYAELDTPLFVEIVAEDKGYKGERLTSVRMSTEFIQSGQTIGRAWLASRLVWWAR
jgi:hypothetical protein